LIKQERENARRADERRQEAAQKAQEAELMRQHEETLRQAREARTRRHLIPVTGKVHDFEVIDCGSDSESIDSDQVYWSRGEVYVDGEFKGRTNEEIQVLPGTRTFTIKSEIFQDHEEDILVGEVGAFEIKPQGYAKDGMEVECLKLSEKTAERIQEEERETALYRISAMEGRRNRAFLLTMAPGIPGTICLAIGLADNQSKTPGTLGYVLTAFGAVGLAGVVGIAVYGIVLHAMIPDRDDYTSLYNKNTYDSAMSQIGIKRSFFQDYTAREAMLSITLPLGVF